MNLGRILKDTRIKRGISLTDVSRELLISEEYLEAIEDGIDEVLPSETYKRIYTRAYCKFLGIEFKKEELSASIKIVTSTDEKIQAEKEITSRSSTAIKEQQDPDTLDFEIPFDINRGFRIFIKIAVTVLVIYLIVRFFMWIF